MTNNKTRLYLASRSSRKSSSARSVSGTTTLRVAYDQSAEMLDLSGTVNQYGPPQSVIEALGGASALDLQMPPWEASTCVRLAYSEALNVPAGELVSFRGIADFIGATSQTVPHELVSVPLPAPASLLRAFPGRQIRRSLPGSLPSLELINEGMGCSEIVFITNPDHLLGTHLDPSALIEIALAHPDSILVADETYIDFLAEPARESLISAPADNVIVLRTISEFFGIPSSPAAVAWCADPARIARMTGRNRSQPEEGLRAVETGRQIGGIDALATAAALDATDWAERAKLLLTYDALWLSKVLARTHGRVVEHDVGVHFRALLTRHARLMSQTFRSHGVQVLVLGGSNAEGPRGLRIQAPNFEGQAAVEAAVAEITEQLSASPGPGREEVHTDSGA